jgi:hypothetical protein
MTKRLLMLALAMALLVVGAAPAIAGNDGGLKGAFYSETSQYSKPGFDVAERPEGFISPFVGVASYEVCDELVLGTWFTLRTFTGETKADLDAFTSEFFLDGEPLDAITTNASRIRLNGELFWANTTGVPVIGTLDPGAHTLEVAFFIDGIEVPFSPFPVEIDVSPDNC